MSTREIRKKKRTSVISISKKKLSIDKSVDKSLKKTNDDRGRSPTRNKESNAKVERRGSSAGRVRPSGIDLQTVKPAASGPISARRRLKRSQFREDDITFGIASFQSSQNGKGAVLDSNGISPLYKAASSGNLRSIQMLQESKWNIDVKNKDGTTPLHAAVRFGHYDVAEYLLSHGANVNYVDKSKSSLLHMACENGFTKIVKLLISNNIDSTLKNSKEETALMIAVRNNQELTVRYLLAHKLDPTITSRKTGNTCLHHACINLNREITRTLLIYKANPTAANIKGETPFDLIYGNWSAFEHIENDSSEKERNNFCEYITDYCCKTDSTTIYKALSSIDYYQYSYSGDTSYESSPPLVVSLKCNSLNMAELLIDIGVPVTDIKNDLPKLILETESKPLLCKMILSMSKNMAKKKFTCMSFANCQLPYISPVLLNSIIECLEDPIIQQRVKSISFKNNDIQNIPTEILKLPESLDIKFEGNPLELIPDEFKQSWTKTREYLSSIGQRSGKFQDCKIMFLGQESCGKTSLLRNLTSKRNKSNYTISSFGLQIACRCEFQINEVSAEVEGDSQSINFNIWDFSREAISLSLPRLFFTNNCVYVLTFNIASVSKGQELFETESKLTYWMQTIRLATLNSKNKLIYLIGTHSDTIEQEEIDKNIDIVRSKFSRQKYPGLQDVFAVSCKTGDGITELNQRILNDISKGGLLPIIPPSWVKLYDILFPGRQVITLSSGAKRENWITRAEFDEMANRCGVSYTPSLCEFLQDMGTIFSCKLNETLNPEDYKEIVIIKPQWLMDIAQIIFSDSMSVNGIISKTNITKNLSHIDKNIHTIIMDIFDSYLLAFPANLRPSLAESTAETGYFLPFTLPENPNIQEFSTFWLQPVPEDQEIGRIYIFPFLPINIVERLIIRIAHTPNFIIQYLWRCGGLFIYRQNTSVFKIYIGFEPSSLKLTIRMRCVGSVDDEVRSFTFTTLIDAADSCLEEYKLGDATTRFIPCYHCVQQLNRGEKSLGISIGRRGQRESTSKIGNMLPKWLDYSSVFLFSFVECVISQTDSDGMLFCHHIRSPTRIVDIKILAPDIALSAIPIISPKSLIVEKKIGSGGFGTVYKGKLHMTLKNSGGEDKIVEVAIKEANVSAKENDFIYADFKQEAFIMSQLEYNPYLLKIFGVTLQPNPRMVIEYIPNGDLYQFIKRKDLPPHTFETFPAGLRLKIALEIAEGMLSLHSQNPPLIHRDLRSPNIFVISFEENHSRHIKVADFGLTRFASPKMFGVLDTWQWLAPEVIGVAKTSENVLNSKGYSCPSDVYSFAICCWELVRCEFPFREYGNDPKFCRIDDSGESHVSLAKIKRAIYHENLRPKFPESSQLPEEFFNLIRDCWKNIPSERPTFKEIVPRMKNIVQEFYGESKSTPKNNRYRCLLGSRGALSRENLVKQNSASLQIALTVQDAPSRKGSDNVEFYKEVVAGNSIRLPMKLITSCLCIWEKFDPKNNQMWIGTLTGTIVVVNTGDESLPIIVLWDDHQCKITSIQLVYNSIWSATENGTIMMWDATYQLLKEWKVFKKKKVSQIYWARSSCTVWILGEHRKHIRVYDHSGNLLHSPSLPKGQIAYSICESGNFIWIGGDKLIMMFDSSSTELVGSFQAHESNIISIAKDSSSRIWTAASDGEIAIWDVNGGDIRCNTKKSEQVGQDIFSLSPWGKGRILSNVSDKSLLWDIEKLRPIQEIEYQNNRIVSTLALDENRVIMAYNNGKLVVYQIKVKE